MKTFKTKRNEKQIKLSVKTNHHRYKKANYYACNFARMIRNTLESINLRKKPLI